MKQPKPQRVTMTTPEQEPPSPTLSPEERFEGEDDLKPDARITLAMLRVIDRKYGIERTIQEKLFQLIAEEKLQLSDLTPYLTKKQDIRKLLTPTLL